MTRVSVLIFFVCALSACDLPSNSESTISGSSSNSHNNKSKEQSNLIQLAMLVTKSKTQNDEPIFMLNMIKYKADKGESKHKEYLNAAKPLIDSMGAITMFMATPAELIIGKNEKKWDLIFVIEYPNRQTFLDLLTSPEYKEIVHLREASIEQSVLLSMTTNPMISAINL